MYMVSYALIVLQNHCVKEISEVGARYDAFCNSGSSIVSVGMKHWICWQYRSSYKDSGLFASQRLCNISAVLLLLFLIYQGDTSLESAPWIIGKLITNLVRAAWRTGWYHLHGHRGKCGAFLGISESHGSAAVVRGLARSQSRSPYLDGGRPVLVPRRSLLFQIGWW